MIKVLAIAQVVWLEMIRRKDIYVLLIITVAMTLLLGAVNVFNQTKIVRYMKEICLLLIWISSIVMAVVTTARQLPAEKENRTLFPLLAKPVSRGELLIGKFLGCWGASIMGLFLLYLAFVVLTGWSGSTTPLMQYFQAFGLHAFGLGVICAITITGSILLPSAAANASICFFLTAGILIFARYLKQFSSSMAEPAQTILLLLYYLIPHLEMFDIRDLVIHSWPLIPWPVWLMALGYAGVYILILLGLGLTLFNRKRLNN